MLTPELRHWFANDIWKERRGGSRVVRDGTVLYRRPSDGVTTIEADARLYKWARDGLGASVPRVIRQDSDAILLPVINGRRASDILRTLQEKDRSGDGNARSLASSIVDELAGHLRQFQSLSPSDGIKYEAYPVAQKLIEATSNILGMLDMNGLNEFERNVLEKISSRYAAASTVIFRDLNPNNVIIACGLFSASESAMAFNYVDFSSAKYLVPREDDWATLRLHQTTMWISGRSIAENVETFGTSQTALCALLVRFHRLALRKAAYKVAHPRGYLHRYESDPERHYFGVLRSAVNRLCQTGVISPQETSSLLGVFQRIDTSDLDVPEFDAFLDERTNVHDEGL